MLKQFGIKYVQFEENKYNIEKQRFRLEKYQIEPDMSGACYFYAMSLMIKKKVLVKNLHLNSMQGDIKFLYALKKMGCLVKDTDEGIIIDGSNVSEYKGIEIDMNDFSDQALTMACVAAFAKSKTLIKNVGHIKMQECDRVNAIITNLNCLGIKAREELADGKVNICIEPGKVVVYDRNYITNRVLEENGIQVLEMPSSELSRGRGGPRCMSMPLIREDM